MVNWESRYVGIPYKDDGLDRTGLHCWGLVRLVFQEQCGIELPSYGEYSARDLITFARESSRYFSTWQKVTDGYQPFDVALMTAMTPGTVRRRISGHCGILVNPQTLLHVWSGTDTVQMPLDHPRIRHTIVGFYRHNDIAKNLGSGKRESV